MNESLNTIIGVPGTLTYVTDAIDSISEFAKWFDGVKQDSSYNALMSYIESNNTSLKDELVAADSQIISSYEAADRNIITNYQTDLQTKQDKLIAGQNIRIENNVIYSYDVASNISELIYAYRAADAAISSYLNASYTYVLENKQDKLVAGDNITINGNLISSTGGAQISINDNASLKIGNITYTLVFEDGKLGFSEYSAMQVTSTSGGGSVEFNTILSNSQVKFKIITNNNILDITWKDNNNNVLSENIYTESKSSEIIVQQNGNNTLTRKYTVSDGKTSVNGNISLEFNKYRLWIFQTSSSLTINDLDISINDYKPDLSNYTVIHNNTYSSEPNVTCNTSSVGFIYILIKKSWNSKKFYFGSSFPEDRNSDKVGDTIIYNSIQYTLYKSENIIPSGKEVKIS